jgi:hypothetical protein
MGTTISPAQSGILRKVDLCFVSFHLAKLKCCFIQRINNTDSRGVLAAPPLPCGPGFNPVLAACNRGAGRSAMINPSQTVRYKRRQWTDSWYILPIRLDNATSIARWKVLSTHRRKGENPNLVRGCYTASRSFSPEYSGIVHIIIA